ncbi:MAG: PAS domain S-box protein, partial [Asticcacaulis sp.]|nr:PAS domain S-box protein [Asticcacaulis sp.]
MFRTLLCLRDQHDLGLVVLAAIICLTSSFAAIQLMQAALRAETGRKLRWLCLAGATTGFGVWATHFIAMLAYNPGIRFGFDITLTLASLLVAVIVTGAGMALAVYRPFRHADWAGGALVGSGIGAMHFIGMAAVEVPARIQLAPDLVIASLTLGALLAAGATALSVRASRVGHVAAAAGVLVLAIVSLHFTAMGAVTVVPDPTRVMTGVSLSPARMSTLIATAAFGVLLAGLITALFGQKLYRLRSETENRHRLVLDSLQDYAICMLDTEGHVTEWNRGAEAIKGYEASEIIGQHFSVFYSEDAQRAGEPKYVLQLALEHGSYREPEALRVRKDGSTFWVDLVVTAIYDQNGKHIGFSKVTRDITARKEDEARINYMAQHDALTGLPNRLRFLEQLDQDLALAGTRAEQVAVIGIDLDGFKEINDQKGHAAGDAVLRVLGDRLKALAIGHERV